ncbi:MAG TPA: hypothetical protein VG733_01140 [Chthoniobacteraceae bacterium]|nr:hypothetical protein [Chthoniobacteraceae bacterium]
MKLFRKLFFCAVAFFVVFLAWTTWRSSAINGEAQNYLDAEMPRILANWDSNELWDRSSRALQANMGRDRMKALFSQLSAQLGPLSQYDGVTSVAGYRKGFGLGGGEGDTAIGLAGAHFARGPGSFKVALVRHDGKWQINAFYFLNERPEPQ